MFVPVDTAEYENITEGLVDHGLKHLAPKSVYKDFLIPIFRSDEKSAASSAYEGMLR